MPRCHFRKVGRGFVSRRRPGEEGVQHVLVKHMAMTPCLFISDFIDIERHQLEQEQEQSQGMSKESLRQLKTICTSFCWTVLFFSQSNCIILPQLSPRKILFTEFFCCLIAQSLCPISMRASNSALGPKNHERFGHCPHIDISQILNLQNMGVWVSLSHFEQAAVNKQAAINKRRSYQLFEPYPPTRSVLANYLIIQ